jgi:hypothetical protein
VYIDRRGAQPRRGAVGGRAGRVARADRSARCCSSDAFGLPELHYLGAIGFRRDIALVTGRFVADGAWTAADADRVAALIGSGNANRAYRLDNP